MEARCGDPRGSGSRSCPKCQAQGSTHSHVRFQAQGESAACRLGTGVPQRGCVTGARPAVAHARPAPDPELEHQWPGQPASARLRHLGNRAPNASPRPTPRSPRLSARVRSARIGSCRNGPTPIWRPARAGCRRGRWKAPPSRSNPHEEAPASLLRAVIAISALQKSEPPNKRICRMLQGSFP